ncbi:unnamed protein product [Spirodela intermedia]|uniref:Uncharacterized protein n=1 Tax=Spirodela intermedia TaxID=51605 RepID=A0A7I8IVP3_SPIIN|nr:unnamed protein product [Spirodela intermedia]CAA6661889.1 unnamed protein product [Spirodela intermedia]
MDGHGAKLSQCTALPRDGGDGVGCLSWRVAVETGNLRGGGRYMVGGEYQRELEAVVEQIYRYMEGVVVSGDGRDAWVLDVDDTCLSNLRYYQGKRFGGEPFDPTGFRRWAERRVCPAIPPMLRLVRNLVKKGFKVFLLTGRDSESLGRTTSENLHTQGFVGYERLVMSVQDGGEEAAGAGGVQDMGQRGDQWTDLLGDHPGDRTFKLPNPMYFVP